MRFDEGHHAGPTAVRDAKNPHFAIVVGDVFQQPIDGVVSVGTFINAVGDFRVARHAQHFKLAFGKITPPNVLVDKNETFFGQFQVAALRGRRIGYAVGRAHEQKREGLFAVFGNKNDGVQFDAVAHGDQHHFLLVLRFGAGFLRLYAGAEN